MLNAITQTKICSQCGQEKPLSEFHRRRHYVRCGYRAACKACIREAIRRDRLKKPIKLDLKKHSVRVRTQNAIQQHILIPQPCSVCGNPAVEAHHPDYDIPNAHLQVEWLCKKHHALLHGKRSWTKQLELFVEW